MRKRPAFNHSEDAVAIDSLGAQWHLTSWTGMEIQQSTIISENGTPQTAWPQRVVAVLRTSERLLRRLALAGLISSVTIWILVFYGWLALPTPYPSWSIFLGILLLLPPAVTGLTASLFKEVLKLPKRLQKIPSDVAESVTVLTEGMSSKNRRGMGRLLGIASTIWNIRKAIGSGRDFWLRAVGAVRLARLASLPVILAAVVSIPLCGLLIPTAFIVLLVVLL